MKILVTGGTGVIGAGAIPALLAAGHDVRLLSRHAEHDVKNFPEGVEAFEVDIANRAGLADAVKGCDGVLHIAGIVEEDPPRVTFQTVNVEGTRHMLEAARIAGSPLFVYVSSLGVDRGESDYHRSKRDAEQLVRDYKGSWAILRPGAVYGPGDETVSMLLRMVRTLPAVPIVNDGGQPFQPLWFEDFGRAIAQMFARPELAGKTLELAGMDVTTTADVLDRLARITARNPPRLAVPAWLAQVGAQALEAFGATGKKILESAGLDEPIGSAKLSMLMEGNVISEGQPNALTNEFDVRPTPLDEGLERLADLLPEQLPGEGVGAVNYTTYEAEITGTRYSATALLDQVCERITDVMPIEFAAEPGAPTGAKEGETLTAEIKGRGKVQVRLDERTPNRATFVTVTGHPLAGAMQLHAEDVPGGVWFAVHTAAQPANVFDWFALRTVGERMQAANWRNVVQRVVELSGGAAPDGVRRTSHAMNEEEAHELDNWLERIVQRQQRARQTEQVENAGELADGRTGRARG